jgi:mRNA interferase RelE/StbE
LAWTIEVSSGAERQLRKLDRATSKRLVDYLKRLVADNSDPRQRGKALRGPLTGLWRYRVGDYRLVCELIDERLVVLVVRLGHRSTVYD